MTAAIRAFFLTLALWSITTGLGFAQATIDLSGLKQDTSLPVEVTADRLSVDQATGLATFEGNVVVIQGEMRISAGSARIEYLPDGKGIAKVLFDGRVLFASPTDAAEASSAIYTIASGEVVMTGDVLLTQGQTTISGNRLVYNLDAGTGSMEGRVQTTFVPGKANP